MVSMCFQCYTLWNKMFKRCYRKRKNVTVDYIMTLDRGLQQLDIFMHILSYLVVLSRYIWYIHIVSRGANIFQLFSSENIESDQMDFSMSMLSCLGGWHLNNFAGATWITNEENLFSKQLKFWLLYNFYQFTSS